MSKREMTGSKRNLLAAGIALLGVLWFASCTEDEAPGASNDDRLAPLALTTLKATDIDVKEIATRAATTKDYPTADSIGFFVKADAANGYTACNNRKGKYSTARNRWLPVDTIWLNSHNADIAIYAPYDASHTTPATLNLTAALRPADGSKDIWCKHTTANNTSKNLAVTLEHVYTRFYLTVKRDANYKADASLTALALKGENVYESATYKPFETTPYTYSTTTGLTPTVTEQALNASTASATYDLLLIPAELTGDLTLTLTVDGKKMETAIDKTRFAGSKLEAGKQYNVNLTLKPGKLEIASVAIVKWDALPEINGGQAEFEESLDIDIGLDFVIAPGNLRAVKPAGSSTYEYFFAEEQGYYSGVLGSAYDPAGGDYFCWNTLSPDDIVRLDFMNIVWDNTLDPCRKIDTGEWYTPSSAQLRSIIDKGDVLWGAYIMKDGSTRDGMYFGTSLVPLKANQDNFLFLPAAGYRDNTGMITNDERHKGCCWSTTRSSIWAENPFGLSFSNVSNSAYTGTGPDTYSDTGMPVRCVKDKPIEHAIDLEGLDFYVADGNLRAIKQADNTYKYSFAEEQGYYSGVYGAAYDRAGGDYFCWNTLSPDDFNITQTEWKDERDPCRQIEGGQWYTPTQDQIKKFGELKTAGKAVWGTYTMKDGTTPKYGWYFGTGKAPTTKADQDKYVFLPAAGYRYDDTTGTISDEGSSGYGGYWSSTPNGSSLAYLLYFSSSAVTNGMYSYYRYFGRSVRCVRNK